MQSEKSFAALNCNNQDVLIAPDTDLDNIFSSNNISEHVQTLLATQNKLRQRISQQIIFSKPILTYSEGFPVLYPNTIMVIQGQSGVHKSRVAESICSLLISKTQDNSMLGFVGKEDNKIHVLYADTERNLTDQFPYALQQIIKNAGYHTQAIPDNFSFISLMEIDRTERFNALKSFVEYERARIDPHLVIVLDVTTDCVQDFNKPEHTMQLIDLINRLINSSNCTLICIIHENPGSEKARGHLGTEIMNKASTVLQVGYVKKENKSTDIIELKFLKMRSNKRPESIFCKYSDTYNGLVLAETEEIANVAKHRKQGSVADEVIEHLQIYFDGILQLTYSEVINKLCTDFNSKGDAMRKRIKNIIENEMPIKVGIYQYKLLKQKEGRHVIFKLIPIILNTSNTGTLE